MTVWLPTGPGKAGGEQKAAPLFLCEHGYDLYRHPCPQSPSGINPRSLTDVVQHEKQKTNIERTWGKKQAAVYCPPPPRPLPEMLKPTPNPRQGIKAFVHCKEMQRFSGGRKCTPAEPFRGFGLPIYEAKLAAYISVQGLINAKRLR